MCYEVWNGTDGIPASDKRFRKKEDAEKFCEEFRDRFVKLQGYYLTSSMERIKPEEIILDIVGVEKEQMDSYEEEPE